MKTQRIRSPSRRRRGQRQANKNVVPRGSPDWMSQARLFIGAGESRRFRHTPRAVEWYTTVARAAGQAGVECELGAGLRGDPVAFDAAPAENESDAKNPVGRPCPGQRGRATMNGFSLGWRMDISFTRVPASLQDF